MVAKTTRVLKSISVAVVATILVWSCTKEDAPTDTKAENVASYDAEVVVAWYSLIKTLTTETPGYTPPVAARAFGYTGVALYEAMVSGMPHKKSLSGQLTDFEMYAHADPAKSYHWPTVANAVLAKMTGHFYANASEDRLTAMAELKKMYDDRFSAETGEQVFTNSILLAEAVSDNILAWSYTDGGRDAQFNNFPSDYVPPAGPGFWVPTAPDYQAALQPYWGSNRPFLKINVDDCQPASPPAYSTVKSSMCYERAMEVYEVVNNLTPEQKVIAEFWSDDPVTTATPPGHSISILNQLIEKENANLAVAVEAFAKLGIGISDAFISCWKTKYTTSYQRPITYIRDNIDADWNTVLPTPPFPEYTSGHSVQSGALAAIMTDFFGENYTFTDHTHENRTDINGSPRTYASFTAMAEEAALSRLYGGIHYHEAIFLGLEQGYQIGANVNALDLDQ